jgi:hypothetical protein
MTMEAVLERLHRSSVGGIGVELTEVQEYLWLCHGNSSGNQKGERLPLEAGTRDNKLRRLSAYFSELRTV